MDITDNEPDCWRAPAEAARSGNAKKKAVDLSAPEQSERVIYLQKCMQLNAANVGTLAIRRQLPGCHCSKS